MDFDGDGDGGDFDGGRGRRAPSPGTAERRKLHHSAMEKEYRKIVNGCLDELRGLVPGCQPGEDGRPANKAEVLQRTVAYIKHVQAGGVPDADEAPPTPVLQRKRKPKLKHAARKASATDSDASPWASQASISPLEAAAGQQAQAHGQLSPAAARLSRSPSQLRIQAVPVSPMARYASPQPVAAAHDVKYSMELLPSLSVPGVATLPIGLPASLPMHLFDPTTGQVLVVEYSPSTPRTAVHPATDHAVDLLTQFARADAQGTAQLADIVQNNALLSPGRTFRSSVSEADLTTTLMMTQQGGMPEPRPAKRRRPAPSPSMGVPPQNFLRQSISVPNDLGAQMDGRGFVAPAGTQQARRHVPGAASHYDYGAYHQEQGELQQIAMEGDEFFHMEHSENEHPSGGGSYYGGDQ
ncbi:hypothetical protein DFJ74DRAFT_690682 [Hyaloraphidium curvatum]|nr:hypothetical protein DFJ74DRAFT_690682 [Hyaloraphidium curvatum]